MVLKEIFPCLVLSSYTDYLLQPECEKSDSWTEAEQGSDECDEGFRMTSGGCEDVDECREDNGGCDEDCLNKPGSYMCR